jgi:hypothetical protein
MSSEYAKGRARTTSCSSSSSPFCAKAKKSCSHGSPWQAPWVGAMVAAEPRSPRGVGVAYDQVAKSRRDWYLCVTASSMRWKDSVLNAFRRSSYTVQQPSSAGMPAARAWPTRCAPPGTPMPSPPCRWQGHTALRYQTSPIALGWMPPPGLDMGRRVHCGRVGKWGSFFWSMVDMSSSTAISVSWLALTAAFTCLYVKQLGPAADPRGTLSSTLAQTPEVIWTGHSSVAGNCDVPSCGCKTLRRSSPSSVTVASRNSSKTQATQKMLPSCSWQRMCRLCWWCSGPLRKPPLGRPSSTPSA